MREREREGAKGLLLKYMSYFWEEYLFSREKKTFFSRIKCATSPKKTFFQLIKYNFVFNFDLNIILFRIHFRKIQI